MNFIQRFCPKLDNRKPSDMRVHDFKDAPLERPDDQRQVETVEQGACASCRGWGYPVVDFIPTTEGGGRALLRIKSKACRDCDGSGLDKARHTPEQITAGRAYHNERLIRLLKWTTLEVAHKMAQKSGRMT
jgi:hypothetical protein